VELEAAQKLPLTPTLTKTEILESALARQVKRARQWLAVDSIVMEPIHHVIGPQGGRPTGGRRK
jgi:hypothetical protein